MPIGKNSRGQWVGPGSRSPPSLPPSATEAEREEYAQDAHGLEHGQAPSPDEPELGRIALLPEGWAECACERGELAAARLERGGVLCSRSSIDDTGRMGTRDYGSGCSAPGSTLVAVAAWLLAKVDHLREHLYTQNTELSRRIVVDMVAMAKGRGTD